MLSGTWVPWRLALAFNLGSFVVEYGTIVAHVRLLTELKERADRMREERYGGSGQLSVVSKEKPKRFEEL